MEGFSPRWNTVMKFFAAFGLAAFLLLAVLLISALVRRNFSDSALALLLSAFSLTKEEIIVEASPVAVVQGDKLNLSWTHKSRRKEGGYELRYPCVGGVAVKSGSGEDIVCGQAFNLGNVSSLVLSPDSATSAAAQLPLEIGFLPADGKGRGVSGSVVVTVNPGEPARADETPFGSVRTGAGQAPTAPRLTEAKTRTYPVGLPPRVLPNGVPDLSVKVMDTGVIDEATGEFRSASSTPSGGQAAVVFDVENVGTGLSAKWHFGANLPVYDGNFVSEEQDRLAPGDKVRFTLGFRGVKRQGENTVVVTVDPKNEIRDANRANDSAQAVLIRD